MGLFSRGPKCSQCEKVPAKIKFINGDLYDAVACKQCGKMICGDCEKKFDKPENCIYCGGNWGVEIKR